MINMMICCSGGAPPEYLNIEHAAAVVLHKTISVSMAHAADRGLRCVWLCVCWGLGRLCQEKILC